MNKVILISVASLCLIGCASDSGEVRDGAGACPDEVGEQMTWTYGGSDDTCRKIETALNNGGTQDDEDDDSCVMMSVTQIESANSCTGIISAVCSGVMAKFDCTFAAGGDVDCQGAFRGDDHGTPFACALQLRYR
jgi:hypothetical protein